MSNRQTQTMKYKGLFWEFDDLLGTLDKEIEYSDWDYEKFKNMIDWCAENSYNVLVIQGFDFCDLTKYPYMEYKDRPVGRFFKKIVVYAKSMGIEIYPGFRLCSSMKFISNNSDCKAFYDKADWLYSDYAWCTSNKKVVQFLKDCTEYYLDEYDVPGILYHSSEAPHCECEKCSRKELWQSTLDILKELKPLVDKRNKKVFFVPTSYRGFDDHLKVFDAELPGMTYIPWDYSDPGSPGFTAYSLEKRIEKYTAQVNKIWLVIPCGNLYMMNYLYPVPEVMKMWKEAAEKCNLDGLLGYTLSWKTSLLNRIFLADSNGKTVEELAASAVKNHYSDKLHDKLVKTYMYLVDFIYSLWKANAGFQNPFHYQKTVDFLSSFPNHRKMLLQKAARLEEEAGKLEGLFENENFHDKEEISFIVNNLHKHSFRVKALCEFACSIMILNSSSPAKDESRWQAMERLNKAYNFYKNGKDIFEKIFDIEKNYMELTRYQRLIKYIETGNNINIQSNL